MTKVASFFILPHIEDEEFLTGGIIIIIIIMRSLSWSGGSEIIFQELSGRTSAWIINSNNGKSAHMEL